MPDVAVGVNHSFSSSNMIVWDYRIMTAKKSVSVRELYAAAFLARGVAGLEAIGFHKANFEGIYHGKESSGIFAPMVRLSGAWVEFINVTFAPSQPNLPLIKVTTGVFEGKTPAIEDLDGGRITELIMAAQASPNTQFSLNRIGWSAVFDRARRYEVKKGQSHEETQRLIDQAIDFILADATELEKTRRYYVGRQGVWRVALVGNALVPTHRILPKSAEMKALLASD